MRKSILLSKRVIATLVASLLSLGSVGLFGLVLTAVASPGSASPTPVLTSCGYGAIPQTTASQAAAGTVYLAAEVAQGFPTDCHTTAPTTAPSSDPTTVDPTTLDPTTVDPTTVAPHSSGDPSGPSFDTGGTVAHTKTGVSGPMIATASVVFVAGVALLVVLAWRRRRNGDDEVPGTVA